MSLSGAHAAAMVACTTLAHLIVLLGGELHPACWAFALASLAWPAWHAAVGPLGSRSATAAALAAVTLPAVAFAAGGAGHARAPASACVALMGVLAVRQASRQLPSHDLQALVLALLLTCAGALLNVTPSYALLLVPFAASGVLALMTRQLCFDLTLAAIARGEAAEAARQLSRRDIVTFRFVSSVLALTGGIFAVAAVTFVAFPRVGLPSFGGTAARGLPREVALGASSWTFADNEVVARVFGLTARDEAQGIYLRGRIYDELLPSGFAVSARPAPRRPLSAVGPTLVYEVAQNVAEGDPLLTLGPVTSGSVATPTNNLLPLSFTATGEPPYAAAAAGSQRARLVGTQIADGSRVPRNQVLPAAPRDEAFRAHYLALPEALREGLRPLLDVALVAVGDPDPVVRAHAIRQHLLAAFVYEEAPPGAGAAGDDALVRFASQKRRGNCTYFAATYAALLRLAGVPSRVVGGYAGGRWDELGQVAILTGSHAHAWVEWYAPGVGWVRDDATPGRTPEVLGRVAAMRERLSRLWQLGVLQYNFGSQLDLWRRTREGLRLLSALALPPAPREARDGHLRHGAAVWAAAIAVAVALAAAAAAMWHRRAARRRHHLGAALQAALEAHLRRSLRPDETLRSAARLLPAEVSSEHRAWLCCVLEMHEAARFFRVSPTPPPVALARRLAACRDGRCLNP